MVGQLWEVVGGVDKGGIIAREGAGTTSPFLERVSTGAVVRELAIVGERLNYELVTGKGPATGWVSLTLSGRDLLVKKEHGAAREDEAEAGAAGAAGAEEEAPALPAAVAPPEGRIVVGPGSGYRHRWAVNIDDFTPAGEENGEEFQFLLGLIREAVCRDQVMKFKFYDDKKRALISRLLVRQASASALGHTSFTGLTITRTKGRKPFLETPLPPVEEAPNWNVNCSHEGSWVVCASEPLCVTGIDVAELRRLKPNGQPIDFHKSFKGNLTEYEWNEVRKMGGDSLDDQYEVFSRFWSAKEAFVKGRGDGIAFELGKAEFHWTPLKGHPPRTAYEATVSVEGRHAENWRFIQHRMPGVQPHWTTVARGPLDEIVDANGVFTRTLRKPQSAFTPKMWRDILNDESPDYDVIPIAALVPQEMMEAYVRVGGLAWP